MGAPTSRTGTSGHDDGRLCLAPGPRLVTLRSEAVPILTSTLVLPWRGPRPSDG